MALIRPAPAYIVAQTAQMVDHAGVPNGWNLTMNFESMVKFQYHISQIIGVEIPVSQWVWAGLPPTLNINFRSARGELQ